MTVTRLYKMTAANGRGEALTTELRLLAEAVRRIDGCLGVELLRDLQNSEAFIFIERWTSIDAHKAGAAQLPKDTFRPVMAVLATPPDGSYLEEVGAS